MIVQCANRQLDLQQPAVMGILNVTPDSFSDGGKFNSIDAALQQSERMLQQGAAIIDVGGESTRPNAQAVSLSQELQRVIPVIEALSRRFDTIISVDTSKPQVMQAAIDAGASVVNDVMALRAEGAIEVLARSNAAVCLMHMQGEPRTMQQNPVYEDVVSDVGDFLLQRAALCERAGIARQRILLDPGFGFGKTLEHNLSLMKNLRHLVNHGLPLVVGVSRKSMIGTILDKAVEQRLYGGIALHSIALMAGASIIRTHDVEATVDAVRICSAVMSAK